ncbi:MAG: MerR family transcriptional regulator [Desulfobacterales bacterium]
MAEKTPVPDKLYFKIGEVSKIAELPTYVLRFWENEFSCIRPKRTSSGQRLYRRADVETVLKIRHLLHERKFTIEGARQFLSTRTDDQPPPAAVAAPLSTQELKTELESIRRILDEN